MARTATYNELQQARAFNADTFAKLQSQQGDPAQFMRQQAASLQPSLDGLAQRQVGLPENVATDPGTEKLKAGKFSDRLEGLKSAGRQAMKAAASPTADAKEIANRTWRQQFDTWMSSLAASILSLEVFLAPWVFFVLFMLRVFAGIVPLRLKGIQIIPPYTMKTLPGITLFIMHLGIFLLITIVLLLIFMIIAFLVWFMTLDFWDKVGFIVDLSEGSLSVLYDLVSS